MGEGKEALDAELYAIKEALLLAQKEKTTPELNTTRIFTDSQRALRLIQQPQTEGPAILWQILTTARKLSRIGKRIILHWTPAHQDIPRNNQADQAAKKAVNYYSRDNTISLLFVRKRIQEKYKLGPLNPLLLRGKRSLTTRYLQLQSGHACVGTYLQRINTEESTKCWWCKERKQSIQHLFLSCREWSEPRKKLLNALRKEKDSPPVLGREEDLKWLFQDRLIPACLQFLKDIQVGMREGIRAEENQADTWDIHLLNPGE